MRGPDKADTVELTGVVTDKFLDRFGKRLVSWEIDNPDFSEPSGWWVVVDIAEFRVSRRLFLSVDVGDKVLLTVRVVGGIRPRVKNLIRGTSPIALRAADFAVRRDASRQRQQDLEKASRQRQRDLKRCQRIRRLVDDNCDVLRNLGIHASVLERAPISGLEDEEQLGWIEIDGGPIKWVQITMDQRFCFWIPDSHLTIHYPHVSVEGFPISSAVPFRHPKSVRWTYEISCYQDEFEDELDPPTDMTFSSQIADLLKENLAVTDEILSSRIGFNVQTHLPQGCWVIAVSRKLDRHIWNCCKAIAVALLELDAAKAIARRKEELRGGSSCPGPATKGST